MQFDLHQPLFLLLLVIIFCHALVKCTIEDELHIEALVLVLMDAFNELITEMDYEDITIKELTNRAMINRNTFYLHYESIDALMQELQDETVEHFIGKEVSYSNMDDLKAMIRVFFERAAQQSPVQEKILTSGSYRFVYDSINKRIMDHRRRTNKGAFGLDEASESIVFAYYGDITAILYRQWVTDGKKLTLDEIIELATKLICEGMGSVVK